MRKITVPKLEKPRKNFDQRGKLSSSSHQKSNPDIGRHYDEELIVSSSSESLDVLEDPWGKTSHVKRLRKMEKQRKASVKYEEPLSNDANIDQNSEGLHSKAVLDTTNLDSAIETLELEDNVDGELIIPFPADISKMFEIQLRPKDLDIFNKDTEEKKQESTKSSCNVLVSTSVQCSMKDDKDNENDTNNDGDDDWVFVPNAAFQQPVLLGHFSRRSQSSELIRVFVDLGSKADVRDNDRADLSWCSCYILSRLLGICFLVAGLTGLIFSALPQ